MYFRVSIKGTIGASEVWSVNPCYAIEGEIWAGWDQELGDAIVAELLNVTVPASLLSLLSSSGTITGYRLECRDDSHTLVGVAESAFNTPKPGTSTATKLPQTAVVLSLRSNRPGGTGRGRLYWPALNVPVNAPAFRVPTVSVQAYATDASSYLTAIGSAILSEGGFNPGTSIPLAVISKTAAVQSLVNRVQVGDVVDTQRRRRDAIPESYVSSPYPAS